MTDPSATLTAGELAPRLESATVIDVRTPGEYASGHLPGAYNVPLDRLDDALPALESAGEKGGLVLVCASGARSATARDRLAGQGIGAASLKGGTEAWARDGHPLADAGKARAVWPMERQVRLAAGSLVVLGILLDLALPGARVLSLLIGGGLVFSALSNTCGMAVVLGKLPHNRRGPGGADFAATLDELKEA